MSRRKLILAKVKELQDRRSDDQCLMDSLHEDCRILSEERDQAIRRAEQLEREIERLGEIVTECDGVECIKHDVIVRSAVKRAARAEIDLIVAKQTIADLRDWIERIPRLAAEIQHAISPGDGTLVIKKANGDQS